MQKIVIAISVLLGIVFLVLSFIYFTTPAHSLPHFLPGFDTTVAKAHTKHAIGSLLLALVLFAFAWFQSGKKSAK